MRPSHSLGKEVLLVVALLAGCADEPADQLVGGSAASAAPRLSWSTPISSETLGYDPNPLLVGVSIESFVSSRITVREDGKFCSDCHYEGSGSAYAPPVRRGDEATIFPDDIIGGRAWAGAYGWGARFVAHDEYSSMTKPSYLREAVEAWRASGERAAR